MVARVPAVLGHGDGRLATSGNPAEHVDQTISNRLWPLPIAGTPDQPESDEHQGHQREEPNKRLGCCGCCHGYACTNGEAFEPNETPASAWRSANQRWFAMDEAARSRDLLGRACGFRSRNAQKAHADSDTLGDADPAVASRMSLRTAQWHHCHEPPHCQTRAATTSDSSPFRLLSPHNDTLRNRGNCRSTALS